MTNDTAQLVSLASVKLCQRTTRESESRCRAREVNKKKEDKIGWYSVSATEEEMEEEKRAWMSHPESWWNGEDEEKEDGRRMDKLAARVQKLEERVRRGMHEKMWEAMSFTGTATEEESTSWKRDGAGGEWQRWEG